MSKKERTTKPVKKESLNVLLSILKAVKTCISLSVDTDSYNYLMVETTKKIQTGSIVLNLRISSKDDVDNCRYLVFVFNRDDKTGLIHSFIMDGNNQNPSILFALTDNYPVNKLERYVPSIISSTQNMIK